MNKENGKLVSWLFETKAVRVCPQNKPFWYTSGTIGPYYINTHFLYGSEEKANELLRLIDGEKNNILTCPLKVLEAARENYNKDVIYRGLIDQMCSFIENNLSITEVDCISGGERRDWFFSLIIAEILKKPHVTIYKDLKTVISKDDKVEELTDLRGKKLLHIADLITEASSYERAWIPAIKSLGGNMMWSLVVIDRKQGGEELLERHGVKSFAMVNVDMGLFDSALAMGLINAEQHVMMSAYVENPKEAMKRFLKEHPEFMQNALNSDEKTRERVRLCIEKNFYDLDIKI